MSRTQTCVLTCVLMSALAWPVSASGQWVSTRGPDLAQIGVFERVGNTLYASSSFAMFRSVDQGLTWEASLTGSATATAIAGDGQAVFVGTEAGEIMVSGNQGQTWTSLASPQPGAIVTRLIFDDGQLYAITQTLTPQGALNPGLLWVSEDEGDTWLQVPMPVPVVEPLYVEGDFMIACEDAFGGFIFQLWRSFDDGTTWEEIGGLIFSAAPIVKFNGSLYMYASNMLMRSDDSGATWDFVSTVGLNPAAIQESRPLTRVFDGDLYIAGHATVARSSDGVNFLSGPLTVELGGSVGMVKFNDTLVFGGFRGVRRGSATTLAGWVASDTGFSASDVFKISAGPSNGPVLANVINTIGIDRYEPNSGQWSHGTLDQNLPQGQVTYELWHDESGTAFAGTQTKGIYRSNDHGANWQPVNAGVPTYNGTAGLQFHEIEAFTKTAGGTIYAATGRGLEHLTNGGQGFTTIGGGIIRSIDGGNTWSLFNTGLQVMPNHVGPFGETRFDPIVSLASVGDTVVAGGWFFGLRRTTGGNWEPANVGIPAGSDSFPFATAVAMHVVDGKIFAGLRFSVGARLVVSHDAGLSWESAAGNLPIGMPTAITDVAGTLYVSLVLTGSDQTNGVWKSSDDGGTWTKVGDELDGLDVRDLTVQNGTVYAATRGLGVWRLADAISPQVGDMNCDTLIDGRDVSAFTLAVIDPTLYGLTYEGCQILNGDFDGDSMTTAADVVEFVAAVLAQ